MPRQIVLLALLALALTVYAVEPPPPEQAQPGPGPLFPADELHANPLHLSLAVVGATPTPLTGPLVTVGSLVAGEQHQAWNLEGVMTNRYSRTSLGAAMLVVQSAGGHPGTAALGQLGLLHVGHDLDCWALLDTDRFRALPRDWLSQITDQTAIGAGGIEAEIYTRVVTRAYYTSPRAFRQAVRKDVTYAHVQSEPERYRGTVIRVEGRLLRVNRFDPPFECQLAGVSDLYEAWIFNEQLGANPYCVLFTHWPHGLSTDLLGEAKIDRYLRVALEGYFFKKYRYKANDPRGRERDAPLVIGHGLLLLDSAATDTSSSNAPIKWLMGLFGAIFGGLVIGVIALTYWYRRSDGQVRQRILARMPEFELPPPDGVPLASPVAPRRPGSGSSRIPIPKRENLPPRFGNSPFASGFSSFEEKESPPPDEESGGSPRLRG